MTVPIALGRVGAPPNANETWEQILWKPGEHITLQRFRRDFNSPVASVTKAVGWLEDYHDVLDVLNELRTQMHAQVLLVADVLMHVDIEVVTLEEWSYHERTV